MLIHGRAVALVMLIERNARMRAKFNFVFNPHILAYVEGYVRGANGTYKAVGDGANLGIRFMF